MGKNNETTTTNKTNTKTGEEQKQPEVALTSPALAPPNPQNPVAAHYNTTQDKVKDRNPRNTHLPGVTG